MNLSEHRVRWDVVELGDMITLHRGYDLPSAQRREGAVPVVSSSGITGYHDESKVQPPGVVTGRYGTLGEVFFVEEPFWPLNTTLYVSDFHGNDERFISYFLQCQGLGARDAASAVPGVNRNVLHRLPAKRPPLSTQRKIAAILSAYDDLIENNNRRITVLEEMAQRIYREWFVDFRYPGHENVRLVDSELGRIPAGWSVSTLGTVCAQITDGAHHSPQTTVTGMPMASVKDMTPRRLDLSTCRLISADDYDSLVRQHCRPHAGDVLISKDGANFLKHIFPLFEDIVAVLLSSVAVLRPSAAITPTVLALALRQPTNKARLKGFVSGAAIPRVVLKDFKRHRLVLPPGNLQASFDQLAEPALRHAVTLESLNTVLRATRNLLLPRLISGEVDVTALDIAMPEVAA